MERAAGVYKTGPRGLGRRLMAGSTVEVAHGVIGT